MTNFHYQSPLETGIVATTSKPWDFTLVLKLSLCIPNNVVLILLLFVTSILLWRAPSVYLIFLSSYLLKVTEQKGRNPAQSIPIRKKRDHGDKDPSTNASNNPDSDIFSNFSSRTSVEQEELDALRVQVDDLQRKVSEKEELLKSSEISKDQMKAIQAKLDEMKHQVSEKDALIKAAKLQLSDAKVSVHHTVPWRQLEISYDILFPCEA